MAEQSSNIINITLYENNTINKQLDINVKNNDLLSLMEAASNAQQTCNDLLTLMIDKQGLNNDSEVELSSSDEETDENKRKSSNSPITIDRVEKRKKKV